LATLAELDARLDQHPDDFAARFERARLLIEAGRRTAAVEDLKVAVLDDAVMAALAEDAGPLGPLLEHPHVVLAMDADPELSRALDALQAGRFAEVLDAPDDGPHPGTAAFLKSVACSELGRQEDSLRWSERASQLLPDVPDTWFNLGCALEALDRRPAALDAYRRSTAAARDFGNGWYNLGLLLRRTADLRGSLAAFQAAVAADPRSSLFVYKLAEAWALSDRGAEAEDELRRAIALDDAARDALRDSALFRRALGDERVRALAKKPKPAVRTTSKPR
jgi:tetratricopeptide (TPR) repeat protein